MRMHIEADDGFYGKDRDLGIIEGMKKFKETNVCGITDVSVLMNGFESHAESNLFQYLSKINHVPGLHLNLTEGTPLSDPHSISSLVDEKNQFFGKHEFRKRVDENKIEKAHVFLEIINQLDAFFRLFHSHPSHVDGHQHFHVIPFISEILAEALKGSGVKYIRIPNEVHLSKSSSESGVVENLDFYKTVVQQAIQSQVIYRAWGLSSTHTFVGMNLMGYKMTETRLRESLDVIIEEFKPIPDDFTIGFMTHPGYRTRSDDLMSGCHSLNGPDDFSQSPEREHELEFLNNRKMLDKLLKSYNITLVSYSN